MTDTTLLRIQNPRAFLMPDLNAFVMKALSSSPLIEDADLALVELVDYVAYPQAGLYLVREGNQYVALALIEHTGSALTSGCTVLHFYNRGSHEARKALIDAIAGFARDRGTVKIWGIDINLRPKGFVKLFKALGPATARGHLYELDLSEGEV